MFLVVSGRGERNKFKGVSSNTMMADLLFGIAVALYAITWIALQVS